jgi:tRNA(Ser,Leu) C12 N-acetylase TAN1
MHAFAENGWEMEIEMGRERKQRRRRVLFLEVGMSKFPGTLMAVYDNDNMNVLHTVRLHHPRNERSSILRLRPRIFF